MPDLKIESGTSTPDGSHDNVVDFSDQEKKVFENIKNEFSQGGSVKIDHGGGGKTSLGSKGDKMNTSSTAGSSGRPVKGGGSPYATSDNFGPSQGASAPGTGGGAVAGSGPQASTGAAPGTAAPTGAVPAGASPTAGNNPASNGAANDLKRMEAQQGKQQNYDKDGDGSKGPKGLRRANPAHVKQQAKDLAQRTKQRAKDATKLPSLNLKNAELGSIFKKKGQAQKGPKVPLKGKLKKYAKKKTAKIIAGGVGLGGAFFLLMLIMFLLGTLLIPHFLSNVLEYQFVRMTRASYESTEEVVGEQEADNSMSAEEKAQVEKDFGTLDNGEPNPILDAESEKLSPKAMNEITDAMDGKNDADEFQENTNADGEVESVTTKNPETGQAQTEDVKGGFQDGNIQEPSAATVAADATAESKVDDEFLPQDGDGPAYQQEVEPVDEGEVDTPPTGLNPDDYPDSQSEVAAEEKVEADTEKAVFKDTGEGQADDPQVSDDTVTDDTAFENIVTNPTEIAEVTAKDGNLTNSLINLINGQFVQNTLDSIVDKLGEFLDPTSAKLIPLCMIFMGSKFNGPAAQGQSNEDQSAAILTMAVADQQKRGSPYVTANMVGAENWKLNGDPRSGGVQDSIPIERASGEKVTTTAQLSAEGSPLGSLGNSGNILEALGIPAAGPLADALNIICPYITNIWYNLGLGVANLAQLFLDPEGDTVEEGLAESAAEGGTEAATDVGTEVAANVVADSVTDESSSGFSALLDFGKGAIKYGKIAGKQGKQLVVTGGLIALATFAAKIFVMAQSGILNGGLATGQQYDNQVDQGTNILANAQVANGYGGRPLSNTEAMQVTQDDQTTLAEINESQSAYQRYLALANPQSLASIMLDRVAVNLNYGFFSSMMTDIGNIFSPASLMPQVLFGGLSGQANAATGMDTQDYGDVQQGYSDQEYALMAREATYRIPSENEFYLYENPAEETEVQQTYSPCFTQSVAELMSEGDIITEAGTGNVNQTQGLCSPQNLGPYNPQYGDLVFRYRLSLGYTTTIDTLEGIAYAGGKLN